MGFWEEWARTALPPAQFRAASRRQAEYDRAMGNQQYGGGPSFLGELVNGWRASRFASHYWQDNRTIGSAMSQPDPRISNVTRMIVSARPGRCSCNDPNCRYNQ